MDMTPFDTRNAQRLETHVLPAERPLAAAELWVGFAYGLFLVPALIVRTFAHLLFEQMRFVGRVAKACAEELARARR